MAKRAPPYSWEIDINEEDNRLKEEFIQSYGEELKLNKRYIDSYEKADINENYDIKNELLDKIIDESNNKFIEDNEEILLKKFNNYLDLSDKIINNDELETIRLDYHMGGYDFFEYLELDKKIEKHNRDIENHHKFIIFNKKQYYKVFDILSEKYGSLDSPISKECIIKLKSKYPRFEWEGIINNFNFKYFTKYGSNRTMDNVYYLYDYIPPNSSKDYSIDKVKISKQIIQYKKGVPSAVSKFTNDVSSFIQELADYEFKNNTRKIYLVSIPSSSEVRDINSSIKKSIKIIVDNCNQGLMVLNKNQEIIDLNELLYRKEDVDQSHLSSNKRLNCDEHIKTIGINKNKLENFDDAIFIILDDITTTGSIMDACEYILMKNGIKLDKIYKLVIGASY